MLHDPPKKSRPKHEKQVPIVPSATPSLGHIANFIEGIRVKALGFPYNFLEYKSFVQLRWLLSIKTILPFSKHFPQKGLVLRFIVELLPHHCASQVSNYVPILC